jgi:hypothetical protein
VDTGLEPLFLHYLEPVPGPSATTSREIVRRAIEFDSPPRIPYSFYRPLRSDFCELVILDEAILGGREGRPRRGRGESYYDEWGVGQRVSGARWDQVFDHPLADLGRLDGHRFPDVDAPERYARLVPWIERAQRAGKYCVGFDRVLMFERACDLLGFQELMVAPYTQPERLEALLDRLADLTVSVIERWAEIGGVDAFMTWQDLGLQSGLPMKLETFRRYYKPRYARIIEAAQGRGMHYIWHCCGQILEMLPDMIELGVDVVQMDQPRLMGYRRLADLCGGKICFWNTLDIQWSTQEGVTDQELRAEVAQMVRAFDRFQGGLMARHYPQGDDVKLSTERHQVIYEAFLANGCALR